MGASEVADLPVRCSGPVRLISGETRLIPPQQAWHVGKSRATPARFLARVAGSSAAATLLPRDRTKIELQCRSTAAAYF